MFKVNNKEISDLALMDWANASIVELEQTNTAYV